MSPYVSPFIHCYLCFFSVYFLETYCQQRLIGDSGTITNQPTDVRDVRDTSPFSAGLCVWIIEGKTQSDLELRFSVLDLPGDCDESYVMLRDGDRADSPILGKYCGWSSLPRRVRPRGSKVWVEYKSSRRNKNGMFVLNWSQTGGKGKSN